MCSQYKLGLLGSWGPWKNVLSIVTGSNVNDLAVLKRNWGHLSGHRELRKRNHMRWFRFRDPSTSENWLRHPKITAKSTKMRSRQEITRNGTAMSQHSSQCNSRGTQADDPFWTLLHIRRWVAHLFLKSLTSYGAWFLSLTSNAGTLTHQKSCTLSKCATLYTGVSEKV